VGKVCGFAVHLASENPNKKLEKLKKKMRKKQRGDEEEDMCSGLEGSSYLLLEQSFCERKLELTLLEVAFLPIFHKVQRVITDTEKHAILRKLDVKNITRQKGSKTT
jgi:hypothetical protein